MCNGEGVHFAALHGDAAELRALLTPNLGLATQRFTYETKVAESGRFKAERSCMR